MSGEKPQHIMCQIWLSPNNAFGHAKTGLPWGLSGKGAARNAGDAGLIPGLGRSPGGGHGNLLQ